MTNGERAALAGAALAGERGMATQRIATAARETNVGKREVTTGWIITLSVVFAVASIALLAAGFALWVPAEGTADAVGDSMTREQNLLVLVAVLGALGAMGYVLRSFSTYVGERKLVWSWVPSYFLVLFLGSIVATITYILLRAGLIGAAGDAEGNTWGFAAVATLVGFFNAQASSKLKDIFEAIFAKGASGGDSLTRAAGPKISTFEPGHGPIGTPITIKGSGLENASTVEFVGPASASAEWDADTRTLKTEVPEGAKSGTLEITVDDNVATSAHKFTVDDAG